MNFSALGSVYYKEKPEYLDQALNSLYGQTLPANEVVLVHDGPLTKELYFCLDKWRVRLSLQEIKLKENVGIAKAKNIGLKQCSFDLVAIFDTDDINKPERFQTQIDYFRKHPNISVLSSDISEFEKTPKDINRIRKLPYTHEEISHYAKFRNPVNNPSTMFKRKDVLFVGGYAADKPFLYMNDYILWLRMLNRGFKFHNLKQILVDMRANSEMFGRRQGFSYAKKEFILYQEKRKLGFANGIPGFLVFYSRYLSRFLPQKMLSFVYVTLLRRKVR